MLGPWIDHALSAAGAVRGLNKIIAAMHPKQLAFFGHPAKAKALLGGRQAGKTYGVAMWLVCDWEKYPNRAAVYITKTATSAVRRIWPMLLAVCRRFNLVIKTNHSALTVTFPNGYTVWITGCKDRNECDKVRGEANGFQKIAIDEPASFSDDVLEYLCTECADACLMQTKGDILLCGTPGPVPKGFWHRICTKMGWFVQKFTALDNPFLDGAGYLSQYLKRYGYSHTTPRVLREFFAEWVIDTESLVYIENELDFEQFNGFHDLPTTRPADFCTLGIDIGYDPDPCAFVIAKSWLHLPNIWITLAYTMPKLTPDKIAMEIRKLKKAHGVHRAFIDAGGGGKTTSMAIQQSYGTLVEPTPKGEKRPKIDTMRGGINSRRILVHLTQAQELVGEYKTILWSEDRKTHHSMSDDHCADAAIQACMPMKQWSVDFVPAVDPWENISDDKRAAFEEAGSMH